MLLASDRSAGPKHAEHGATESLPSPQDQDGLVTGVDPDSFPYEMQHESEVFGSRG